MTEFKAATTNGKVVMGVGPNSEAAKADAEVKAAAIGGAVLMELYNGPIGRGEDLYGC